jgi:hypothetical protein
LLEEILQILPILRLDAELVEEVEVFFLLMTYLEITTLALVLLVEVVVAGAEEQQVVRVPQVIPVPLPIQLPIMLFP